MSFINENDLDESYKNQMENEFDERSDHKNTFVGTAEYVSPEVLVDKGAGPPSDLWALGCIIYQMFAGYSPFKDKTEYLVFKRILEQKYTFPPEMPEEAKSLIKALLIAEPEKRLGSGHEESLSFFALKFHPFFKGLEFETLNKQEPPYRNEFKTKVTKVHQSQQNDIDDIARHKNTIQVIKQDIIEKKSPWFHYNTRKIVLDNTPKIEYIEPTKNVVKVILI